MKLTSKFLPRLPTDGVEDTEDGLVLDEALEAAAATAAAENDKEDGNNSDDSDTD